jgi:hypothetical protein
LGRSRSGNIVGDIEPHEMCIYFASRLDTSFRITSGDPYVVAKSEKPTGGMQVESLVRPRDQCLGHGQTSFRFAMTLALPFPVGRVGIKDSVQSVTTTLPWT